MNKWQALSAYLGAVPNLKPKYVAQHICNEAKDMICAWKADKFAPETKHLDDLTGDEFINKYDELFYETAQHEGAEVIERVALFFETHGIDIFEYFEKLKLKRRYKAEKWQLPEKKIVLIPTR